MNKDHLEQQPSREKTSEQLVFNFAEGLADKGRFDNDTVRMFGNIGIRFDDVARLELEARSIRAKKEQLKAWAEENPQYSRYAELQEPMYNLREEALTREAQGIVGERRRIYGQIGEAYLPPQPVTITTKSRIIEKLFPKPKTKEKNSNF